MIHGFYFDIQMNADGLEPIEEDWPEDDPDTRYYLFPTADEARTAIQRWQRTDHPVHILVATHETQGRRGSDFCHAEEEELLCVVPPLRIAPTPNRCQEEEIDGTCGCHRALVGLTSHLGTTTFKVMAFDGTIEELEQEYQEEWVNFKSNLPLLMIAAQYPIGTILEKRGRSFQPRT